MTSTRCCSDSRPRPAHECWPRPACAARGLAGLAARSKSPAAFDRRGIRTNGVASRSHTACMLPRRALLDRRSTGLGATRGLAPDCWGPRERLSRGWGGAPLDKVRGAAPSQSGSCAHARLAGAEWGLGVPAKRPRGVRGVAPTEDAPGVGRSPTRQSSGRGPVSIWKLRTCAARGRGVGLGGPREAPAWGSGRSPD